MRAPDFEPTALNVAQVDRALEAAAETIEGELHRTFYPIDTTYKWDWPNYQYVAPWKLMLDQWDILALTQLQSPQGTNIPTGNVLLYPPNRRPGWPYTKIELDRSTVSAFGAGQTPQLSIWATGTFGFTNDTISAGQLGAAVTTAGQTTIQATDSSQIGPGDMLVIGTERMVISDAAAVATGLTQSGAGCSTDAMSDNALSSTGSGTLIPGEVLLLGTEQMLVLDVTAGVATVKRQWNGTVLATHSAATIYAYRLFSVLRGQYGTTAATYSNGAAISKIRFPAKIRTLSIAEAVNQVLQETGGWSAVTGAADNTAAAPGAGLAELWDEARAVYGRKARTRAV